MQHIQLSDLFIETFTYAKQLQQTDNTIQYSNVNNKEQIDINLNGKNIELTKSNHNLSLFSEDKIIFRIPILDEPNKDYPIQYSDIDIISELKKLNDNFKISLNVKDYLSKNQARTPIQIA